MRPKPSPTPGTKSRIGRRRSDVKLGANEATAEYYEDRQSDRPGGPPHDIAARLGIGAFRDGPYRTVMGDVKYPDPIIPEKHAGQLVLPGMAREDLQHAVPYHAMNREQFAAQPEIWWHGRYDESPPEAETAQGRAVGVHAGTRQAALDRLKKVGPFKPDLQPGLDTEGNPWTEDENGQRRLKTYEEMGGVTEQPGRLFPMVNTRRMRNSPAKPLNDAGETWEAQMYDRDGEPKETGWYYKNLIEDEGSVSIGMVDRGDVFTGGLRTHGDLIMDAAHNAHYVHPNILHLAQFGAEHTGEEVRQHAVEQPYDEARLRAEAGGNLYSKPRNEFEQRSGMSSLFVHVNEGSRGRHIEEVPTYGGGTLDRTVYHDQSHYMTHEGWETWKAKTAEERQRPATDDPAVKETVDMIYGKVKLGASKPAFSATGPKSEHGNITHIT